MKKQKQDRISEETADRSNIYSLLARVYSEEPNREFFKTVINNDILELFEIKEYFKKKSLKSIEEELAVEYCRLFIGPGKHIYTYESAYREQRGGVLSDTAKKVKSFIEFYGFKYKKDFGGFYDHISAELEFMTKLVSEEKKARENKNSDKTKKILELEKQFIEEHLIKWIPEFSDRVIKEADLSFYKEYAKLTKEFILFEKDEIEDKLKQVKS